MKAWLSKQRGADTQAAIKGNGDPEYDEKVRDRNWTRPEAAAGGVGDKRQRGLSYPQHGRKTPHPAVSRP